MSMCKWYEYFCLCGEFLFNSSDIYDTAAPNHLMWRLIPDWIPAKGLFRHPRNVMCYRCYHYCMFRENRVARCFYCERKMGQYSTCCICPVENCSCNKYIIYDTNLIHKKTIRLDLFRVVDEEGHILEGEYHTQITESG